MAKAMIAWYIGIGQKRIKAFRIIDTVTYEYKDVDYQKVYESLLRGDRIHNLQLKEDGIDVIGSISDYPLINIGDAYLIYGLNIVEAYTSCENKVIMAKFDNIFEIVDYKGKILIKDKKEIFNDIANGYVKYANLPAKINDYSSINYEAKINIIIDKIDLHHKDSDRNYINTLQNINNRLSIVAPDLKVTQLMELVKITDKGLTYENFKVPKGIVKIYRVFNQSKALKNIVLNDGLREISDYAFYNCIQLKKIVIPNTVRKIGYAAFQNAGLEEVKLPENEAFTAIEAYTFQATKLKELHIPDSVDEIANCACANCDQLINVRLSSKVSSISVEAFLGCVELKRVENGYKVVYIMSDAFSGCESLEYIELGDGLDTVYEAAFEDCTRLNGDCIPWKSLRRIYRHAFKGCHEIKRIQLDNIKRIDGKAFYNCNNLEEVIITNKNISIDVGFDAFHNCPKLRKFAITKSNESLLNSLELPRNCEITLLD